MNTLAYEFFSHVISPEEFKLKYEICFTVVGVAKAYLRLRA